MSNFNVGDLVLVQLTPGAVGQRATVTDVYGDEYYGVRVADSGLDTGLSGKFISLIKRDEGNQGQIVTGIVGGSQPVTGELEQSNEDDDLLVARDELTAEQLQELYRIGDDRGCTEEEVNYALDDIFGEDDWTFEDLKVRLGDGLCDRQDDEDDEDNDIATESPSELRQNLNEVRAELEACRTRAADAEAKVASQEAEIKRLKLRAEEAEAKCVQLQKEVDDYRGRCAEEPAKPESGTEQGPGWLAGNSQVDQWYKDHPCVCRSWDIPVIDVITGKTGILEDFNYRIGGFPGPVANVRTPNGEIEHWLSSSLIPMEHVHAGIKSVRAWKELTKPGFIALSSSDSGLTVTKS